MSESRLKDFLDKEHVKYVTIAHSPAFTAQEIAATTHIPGKEIAKTVVVKIDGEMAMVVTPASEQVELNHLKETLGASLWHERIRLASAQGRRTDRFQRRFSQ